MKHSVRIVIRFAWWVRWIYLPGVRAMVMLGFDPDMEKIEDAIFAQGITVEIEPDKACISA
jgi:hypothetical protein